MIPYYRAIQQIESEAVKEVNKFTMTPFFVKGRSGTLCPKKSFIKIIYQNYSFESGTHYFGFFRTIANQGFPFLL
jgi:hypothetical protein